MDNNLDIQVQNLHITQNILFLIAEIDEFKGAWRATGQLAPERLDAMRKMAAIESIGSSTRVGSSRLGNKEVRKLLADLSIAELSTREEQEVAGYAEVMELVCQNYGSIALSEDYIQQLHALLLQYSKEDAWHRGSYKKSSNHIEGFSPEGKSLGMVVETGAPSETGVNMERLLAWTNDALNGKRIHPLLIISVFVVEFLAIHPFQHGNGRLSRVLTTYLLLKNNYRYVPYSSLEAVIEESKEGYYSSLRQTQRTLRSDNPNWQPWVIFFVKALQRQKQRLEDELELEKQLLGQLPDLSVKILEFVRLHGRGTVREMVTITHANRNTIKKHLESLVGKNYLQQNGIGKGTWYSGK